MNGEMKARKWMVEEVRTSEEDIGHDKRWRIKEEFVWDDEWKWMKQGVYSN